MATNEEITYYDILEVPHSASPSAIKSAYHKLAKEYHPDRIPLHLPRVRADAEETFKVIHEAYACLKSPESRAKYDAELRRRVDAHEGTASQPPAEPAPTAPTGPPQPSAPSSFITSPRVRQDAVALSIALLLLLGVEGWRSGSFGSGASTRSVVGGIGPNAGQTSQGGSSTQPVQATSPVGGAPAPSVPPSTSEDVSSEPPLISNQSDTRAHIKKLLEEAQTLFERREYEAALRSCENALALDSHNESARALSAKIRTTVEILRR